VIIGVEKEFESVLDQKRRHEWRLTESVKGVKATVTQKSPGSLRGFLLKHGFLA
jgi:hypothetical protein